MSCPFGYGGGSNNSTPPINASHEDENSTTANSMMTAESIGASIVREEHAKLDYSKSMTYGDYLGLDQILSAQHPLSPCHDEMLFIIQHQTSELWMKLLLHEIRAATTLLANDDPKTSPQAFKMLARVSRILEQLVAAWTVLSTMTPTEYTAMRPYLASSSGFQSYQYRCIEFSLGNKNDAMLRPHAHREDLHELVKEAFEAPSIYDVTLQLMAKKGFAIPEEKLKRDWTKPYVSSDAVKAAWVEIYRDPHTHWELYQLGEKLCDIEDAFRVWRFRHLTTVERVIGFKRGTGGTGGVSYLKKMLDVVLFPEVWSMRTQL